MKKIYLDYVNVGAKCRYALFMVIFLLKSSILFISKVLKVFRYNNISKVIMIDLAKFFLSRKDRKISTRLRHPLIYKALWCIKMYLFHRKIPYNYLFDRVRLSKLGFRFGLALSTVFHAFKYFDMQINNFKN